jgi:cation diffusion facilitator family transporter
VDESREHRNQGRREQARAERALATGLVVNTALALLKLGAGLVSGSPALLADGLHSLGDMATGALAWFTWRWAAAPPDDDHHYGHGKYEALASAVVGVLLVLTGAGLVRESWGAEQVAYGGWRGALAVAAAVVSFVANEGLVLLTRRAARATGSPTLAALARDNRADSLTALIVLGGVVATLAGVGSVEPYVAILIGVFVALMGLKTVKEGADVLMDRVPDRDLRARARAVAQAVEGVEAVQLVAVHPLGSRLRVDMEVSVDGDLSVRKGHAIAHDVELAVTRTEPKVVQVSVHVNPAGEAHP